MIFVSKLSVSVAGRGLACMATRVDVALPKIPEVLVSNIIFIEKYHIELRHKPKGKMYNRYNGFLAQSFTETI